MRYLIEIAYLGTHYQGWQGQKNGATIQGEIESRLYTLLRKETLITGSSRTDTGVHALQQFAHFDTDIPLDNYAFRLKMNSILPKDIAIKKIYHVADDFHARFDATHRCYEYRISRVKNPFLQNMAFFDHRPYQVGAMNNACKILSEHQDFESFSKVKTNVSHFRCDIQYAYWEEKNQMLVFHIKANRFLRGMVRSIVGTILKIGTLEMSLSEFDQVILKKDRKAAGASVPASGLFLTEVGYPENKLIEIP